MRKLLRPLSGYMRIVTMPLPALSRRRILSLTPAAAFAGWTLLAGCTREADGAPAQKPEEKADPIARKLAALERQAGGRLGVWFRDAASGRSAGHRVDARFAMCSTFKWTLSAVVLNAVVDRKRGGWGEGVAVRVVLGGRRNRKKK